MGAIAQTDAFATTVEYVHKVKLIDKGRMQQLLAQHVGLFEG